MCIFMGCGGRREVKGKINFIWSYIFQTQAPPGLIVNENNFREIATIFTHEVPSAPWDPKDAPGSSGWIILIKFYVMFLSPEMNSPCKRDHKNLIQKNQPALKLNGEAVSALLIFNTLS